MIHDTGSGLALSLGLALKRNTPSLSSVSALSLPAVDGATPSLPQQMDLARRIRCLLIFLPNVLWNIKYDWPFLQLIRAIRAEGRDVVLGPFPTSSSKRCL